MDEKEISETIDKYKHDPIFQGTLNQLEIFKQLRQHLTNEVIRYRREGRIDIANLIIHSMTDNSSLKDKMYETK